MYCPQKDLLLIKQKNGFYTCHLIFLFSLLCQYLYTTWCTILNTFKINFKRIVTCYIVPLGQWSSDLWSRSYFDREKDFMTLLSLAFGEGNGTPLQYSCLENPRDRGAWWAAVYGVAQSQTQLKRFSSSSSSILSISMKEELKWGIRAEPNDI